MKALFALVAAVIVSTAFGFFVALFLQALGEMSRQEDKRLADPWVLGDPHDVFVDDALTADKDCD